MELPGLANRSRFAWRIIDMSRVVEIKALPIRYREPTDHNRTRSVCLVRITGEDGHVG